MATLSSMIKKRKVRFVSDNGIRLVEIFNPTNGEVSWFKEFAQDGIQSNGVLLNSVGLDLKRLMEERGYQVLRMGIWDYQGNSKIFQVNKHFFDFIECCV